MHYNALPQPVAARLLELDGRVTAVLTAAQIADEKVAYARSVINGKTDVKPAEFTREREGFAAVYATAQAARQHATAAQAILAQAKTWLTGLPPTTDLLLVRPVTDGVDLPQKQKELTALRAELRQLQNLTPIAEDISTRVRGYVQGLASKATPLLQGYGPNQTLDVRWPGGPDANRMNGNGFSTIDGNALLLFALLQPDVLTTAILRAIEQTQPMARVELQARLDALTLQIDELSYVVAALLDRDGQPPDQLMAPWHALGVRTREVHEQAA